VSGLPAVTRTLLPVAAANDGDALSETMDTAAIVVGEQVTVDDLTCDGRSARGSGRASTRPFQQCAGPFWFRGEVGTQPQKLPGRLVSPVRRSTAIRTAAASGDG
jgi:hypothetical protein